MEAENNIKGISKITRHKFMNGIVNPVSKLMVALVSAFIGSSITGIVVFFIAFMVSLISGGFEGRYPISISEIPMLLLTSGFFTLAYGILVPIFSFFQILILGIPAAIIGWKIKLIRLWTSIIIGILLSSLPWAFFFTIGVMLQSVGSGVLDRSEIIPVIALILVLGLCGGIGGLCFWITLQILRFPDINQSKQPQLEMQNNSI